MGTEETAIEQHKTRLQDLIQALKDTHPPNDCPLATVMRDAVVCLLQGHLIDLAPHTPTTIKAFLYANATRLAWPIAFIIATLAIFHPTTLDTLLQHLSNQP